MIVDNKQTEIINQTRLCTQATLDDQSLGLKFASNFIGYPLYQLHRAHSLVSF